MRCVNHRRLTCYVLFHSGGDVVVSSPRRAPQQQELWHSCGYLVGGLHFWCPSFSDMPPANLTTTYSWGGWDICKVGSEKVWGFEQGAYGLLYVGLAEKVTVFFKCIGVVKLSALIPINLRMQTTFFPCIWCSEVPFLHLLLMKIRSCFNHHSPISLFCFFGQMKLGCGVLGLSPSCWIFCLQVRRALVNHCLPGKTIRTSSSASRALLNPKDSIPWGGIGGWLLNFIFLLAKLVRCAGMPCPHL